MNEEFPPLGGHPKESQPIDTFGFLKPQLPSEAGGRAGTPSLPPGLPLPHAHPATTTLQSTSKSSSPAPIAPPGLSRVGSPPKPLLSDSHSESPDFNVCIGSTPARPKDASRISLGSPVAKSASKSRLVPKNVLPVGSDDKERIKAEQSPAVGAKTSPYSLSMPLAAQEIESVKSERGFSGSFGPAPGSVPAIGSRPNTPLTTASRLSDSAPRQPRILRVVETPKLDTNLQSANPPAVPIPGVGAKSQPRKQSLSSNSRPDTPGDYGSEADFYPSTSVSRANSPPASSRIGSAPVRSITKSQAKKERKQKAKDAEARKVDSASVPEEPVQAPIMGRKRKTKKAPSSSTEQMDAPSPSVTETASPVKAAPEVFKKPEPKPEPVKKVKAKEQSAPDAKLATVDKPAGPKMPAEALLPPNTVEQLMKDAAESGRPVKDLFVERTRPLHEILAEMHKSGALDLNKSSLFNPANLSQRTDMKCSADDYEGLMEPTELTEEHRKALLRGEPVRVGSEQLKNRCLITPRGCVLRHLELEEEERYLELEKGRKGLTDPTVVGDDSSNINGGLEALFAAPRKYNIRWVDEASTHMCTTSGNIVMDTADPVVPPNVLSAMEADSSRNHDWAVAQSAELLQTTSAAVRSFAAATAKQMLGSSMMPGSNPTLDDVAEMTDQELKDLAGKSQKDLEGSRKELDGLEKKFTALLRRNKKVQQQALGIVAGSDS